MATYDDDNEENEDEEELEDSRLRRRPRKKPAGMSTAVKVILGLSIAGAICGLLCCGGVFFVGYQAQKGMTVDPEKIRAITNTMVNAPLPAEFVPVMGIDIFGAVN